MLTLSSVPLFITYCGILAYISDTIYVMIFQTRISSTKNPSTSHTLVVVLRSRDSQHNLWRATNFIHMAWVVELDRKSSALHQWLG